MKSVETGEWYHVTLEYAKEKVSHALRSKCLSDAERQERKQARTVQQKLQRQQQQQQSETAAAYNGNNKNMAQVQSNSQPRRRRVPNKNTLVKLVPPHLEGVVHRVISDQQVLLALLIQRQDKLEQLKHQQNARRQRALRTTTTTTQQALPRTEFNHNLIVRNLEEKKTSTIHNQQLQQTQQTKAVLQTKSKKKGQHFVKP